MDLTFQSFNSIVTAVNVMELGHTQRDSVENIFLALDVMLERDIAKNAMGLAQITESINHAQTVIWERR